MSSHEQNQNNDYDKEPWKNNFNGEENMPRPPSYLTESRVLNYLQNAKSLSEGNSGASSGATSTNSSQSSQVNFSPGNQQPMTLPNVNSSLNALAREFVPNSQKMPTVSNDNQNLVYNHNNGYTATEFGPQGGDPYNSYNDPYYQNVPYDVYDDSGYFLDNFNALDIQDQYDPLNAPSMDPNTPVLDRFKQTLQVLTMHPGNMEEYLRPICEIIKKSSNREEIAKDLIESLFNQSINEANFRYTGARICQFLNANLNDIPHFSGFTKLFLQRCQQDYIRRDELKNGSVEDQNKLRGLAMLMAEIFLNVQTENKDGTIERIHFLPGILVDFVKTLLSTQSDLDVKCSCQLLKLSGGIIEDVVKNDPDKCQTFEEIFIQLQSLESSPNLTENTRFIIGTVLKMKKNNWNRSPSSPSNKSMSSSPSEPSNFQVLDPVFYNVKGAPCSRTEAGFFEEDLDDGAYVLNEEEERAFLKWQEEQEGQTEQKNLLANNDSVYDSYRLEGNFDGGEGYLDEGEMGAEMEAAFEEFLQKQDYQAHVAGPRSQEQYIPTSIPPIGPVSHEQYIPTSIPPIFNMPPPNMAQPQDFSQYQQQFMMQPNQPQLQMPQRNQDQQQQQYQMQQYHQNQQPPNSNNDRYHYHR